jgi:hypothetical protein
MNTDIQQQKSDVQESLNAVAKPGGPHLSMSKDSEHALEQVLSSIERLLLWCDALISMSLILKVFLRELMT